ncbi:MAG: hypothetical protein A2W18_13615 [Candidatus Muproteobacteria bacterium RBG_16_60_9]|uniref:DUF2845 domain-containing protein n=1 Tax=Candidatus Muproteobacteria bacterium RBG_16_60_9 TaxID=1817755 RepID=A0A1F6VL20_9PROT|nr:MAG: hypothetical protein A2W18_13615 [Candidatus Muproteobacteria bacterium RBG_16_60_9]
MMRTAIAGFFVLFLAAAPGMAGSWITGSFRTASGGLVQRGDTTVEVLLSAGEPLERRTISTGIAIGAIAGLTREQWTYRGSDGIYIVTIVGNEVQQVQVVPYR